MCRVIYRDLTSMVALVRTHDRPNSSRLYLSACDIRTKCQSLILVRMRYSDKMPVGYTCPHTIVGRQNTSLLCSSALRIDQMSVGYTCPHAIVGQNSSRLYLAAYMIDPLPFGCTCPHAIVGQSAGRLCLSARNRRTKFQSVILVRTR